ncbi:hypothetical protein [Thomasclavelia ramosa]|uniref:hypothetical protein n=1 Tax=Thomasclavelia ramosa TaxID=1547 RepID=UPI0034A45CF3
MPDKRIFKSLKIKNIYLKSVKYNDFINLDKPEILNISNTINIESNENSDVSFILEKKVLINDGKKAEIIIQIAIQIQVEFKNNKINDIDSALKEIAEKIISANNIDEKISLLIGNITGSLGDTPIMLPLDLYEQSSE